MLTSPLLRRRISARNALSARLYSNGGNGRRRSQKERLQDVKSNGPGDGSTREEGKTSTPSLFEQLFPDQHESAPRRQEREVPRLPLEKAEPFQAPVRKRDPDEHLRSRVSLQRKRDMQRQGVETSVLVLRNASKNLVEEDFRRLIPQGQHMEGWTLEQGDILKVIPGRNLATLAPQGHYYLLFSSPLSAFIYQGHATRIHRLVAAQTPSSVLSPMPPAPGTTMDGIDAHAAIEAFTLVPPNQTSLELRQLKPPLAPMVESLVRNAGYFSLVARKERMPYEVRLTLEGPQLHQSNIRHILYVSGRDRALTWSGGEDGVPLITKWEPLNPSEAPSGSSKKADAVRWGQLQTRPAAERTQMEKDVIRLYRKDAREEDGGTEEAKAMAQEQQRRTLPLVYILGFHTETAMQSFVRFWHRRPMEWEGVDRPGDEEGDLPPIASVERLW